MAYREFRWDQDSWRYFAILCHDNRWRQTFSMSRNKSLKFEMDSSLLFLEITYFCLRLRQRPSLTNCFLFFFKTFFVLMIFYVFRTVTTLRFHARPLGLCHSNFVLHPKIIFAFAFGKCLVLPILVLLLLKTFFPFNFRLNFWLLKPLSIDF